MKNMIFAAIAALFVSVNCAMAQSVEFGSEKKGLVSEASAQIFELHLYKLHFYIAFITYQFFFH